RPGLRGRGARCRPGAGGGRRPGVATSGGQTEMIRINLAPERGRRRGAGFSLSLPAFNLAWLFGVVYLALLLGGGVYWWILMSTKASLITDIDRAQRDLAALKAQIGQETKVKGLANGLRKGGEGMEGSAR